MTVIGPNLVTIFCFSVVAFGVFVGWIYLRRLNDNEKIILPIIVALLIFVMGISLGLYGWPYDGGDNFYDENPLGLIQQRWTLAGIRILIVEAPYHAYVSGTLMALTHENVPYMITNVSLFYPDDTLAASYNPIDDWNYYNGANAENLKFMAEMTIKIFAPSLWHGDEIVISSSNDYYGTTILIVS